ncbi:hypothetical protein RhiirA4_468215 [Rhizophagus irregularis]|uniref:Uncharacterized protein n=1 Tax=Rhizophagus irregularis TaxID=588596 RepID=A0A2I1GXD8_9GLOM|nr:hypothetical protein RhiirA4_468215 [Rhizophagus irregularis]
MTSEFKNLKINIHNEKLILEFMNFIEKLQMINCELLKEIINELMKLIQHGISKFSNIEYRTIWELESYKNKWENYELWFRHYFINEFMKDAIRNIVYLGETVKD